MNLFLYLFVLFISFAGFILAFYIRHKKASNEKMVCPIGADCDVVVHSEYSRFFGIPVEILGMFYYGTTAFLYGGILLFHHSVYSYFVSAGLAFSSVALLFSLYLTFIQAFTLKQWCSWCLTSAVFCAIIFLSSLGGLAQGITVLIQASSVISALQLTGIALGVGGATVAEILFFKFLKDFRISEWEASVIRTISQVIWFALAILVLSGLASYLTHPQILNSSPEFLLKAIAVLVIIANGALLNFIVSPKLILISFGKKHDHEPGELRRLRRISFALGAVSIVSWYAVLKLSAIRMGFISFPVLLALYAAAVLFGIVASQIIERRLSRHAELSEP